MTITTTTLAGLLKLACAYTGYSCEGVELPRVRLATPCQIVHEFEGPNVPCDAAMTAVAYYSGGVMTIPDNFETGPWRAHVPAILFHELIHHLQYLNHTYAKVECRAMLEKEAYYTEARFRYDNNMPPLPFTPQQLQQLTTCQ